MKKDIGLIGLDLDGTLLNDKKEITDYTKEVLERAMAQGVEVVIATGRPLSAISAEVERLQGMRYALTSNGARIVDLMDGKVLFENTMSVEAALRVIHIVKDYDLVYEVFMEGKGYTIASGLAQIENYFGEPGMAEYMRRTRIPVEDVAQTVIDMGLPVEKVHLIFNDMEERRLVKEQLGKLDDILVTGAFKNTMEANAIGTSKANGLIRLGELLGIKQEQIMGCGDGMNDYEMVSKCGFGVAMDNGNPKVKAIADYITVSNNEDGVAKAIEKFVLV